MQPFLCWRTHASGVWLLSPGNERLKLCFMLFQQGRAMCRIAYWRGAKHHLNTFSVNLRNTCLIFLSRRVSYLCVQFVPYRAQSSFRLMEPMGQVWSQSLEAAWTRWEVAGREGYSSDVGCNICSHDCSDLLDPQDQHFGGTSTSFRLDGPRGIQEFLWCVSVQFVTWLVYVAILCFRRQT